ncbi:hypothetical protein [Francisella orientalis]|uniref:Phosphoribosylpyrophosphate synthetase n=1 Tax=Francisella orientalis TaxID=299583 RepID=A0ABM5U617_9GAMM|nr:hypothetical protein [Francisella orientalis]AFJ43787.1 phosphoribosylpyrophosphate synthetase [Francisella orientalis str. Toba 04]AHB99152.1 hypothetical protein M973_04645 [Francisella orientalis LADL 07-285A]AKN85486.1 Phosphoribosylpyrophosphate synthetase [Francisella orientalis FNO12]AKN87025.1 Phosphoribosylpyrophosphate synthetase [Francisella orientalis FNO24]AKN88563.1 Phosphoribosylpyrophosphate synthetase [Francisella orientalis]
MGVIFYFYANKEQYLRSYYSKSLASKLKYIPEKYLNTPADISEELRKTIDAQPRDNSV